MEDQRTELTKDERPIQCIAWDDNNESHWRVGKDGITKIEAYTEHGEMSMVLWLAVYAGGNIIARVPARQVMVIYETMEEQKARLRGDI